MPLSGQAPADQLFKVRFALMSVSPPLQRVGGTVADAPHGHGERKQRDRRADTLAGLSVGMHSPLRRGVEEVVDHESGDRVVVGELDRVPDEAIGFLRFTGDQELGAARVGLDDVGPG